MAVDVKEFLISNNIEYVETGSNVAKGNINIKCPFCGNADPSQHMGINLKRGVWGCWRDGRHRGGNFVYLAHILTGLKYSEVSRMFEINYYQEDLSWQWNEAIQFLYGSADMTIKKVQHIRSLLFPKEFRKINNIGITSRFYNYIYGRGFKKHHTARVINDYDLKGCLIGDYKNRIIIPVYLESKLVSWTARHIGDSVLRYKSISNERAAYPIKSSLYNYDKAISGGDILFIVEGPFDVLKIDYFGIPYLCRAVGLFNMNIDGDQLYWLSNLASLFKYCVVLLDRGELGNSLGLYNELKPIFNGNIQTVELSFLEDPGSLTERQFPKLIEQIKNGIL